LADYATNRTIFFTTVISRVRITGVKLINGARIAELRGQRGLGQRELAAAAQIDHSVISRLERNLQDDCMVSALFAIASILGVPVDDLLHHGQQAVTLNLAPELQAAINQLGQRSPVIQRQAAGILNGYISTLE
jgi:transcriptional regulator with XRE-family HTH domain